MCYLLYFVHSLINGSDLWLCQLPPLPESLKPGTWQIRITECLFCSCNQRGEEPKHVQTAVCLILRARRHISSVFLPFYTMSLPAVTFFFFFLQTCHSLAFGFWNKNLHRSHESWNFSSVPLNVSEIVACSSVFLGFVATSRRRRVSLFASGIDMRFIFPLLILFKTLHRL